MKLLVCKECWLEKNLSEYYKHPLGYLWVMWRCKECIKAWRKSEREKVMSRTRDKDRYYNNSVRRAYIFKSSSERRIRKWYANVHCKANRMIEKYWRPSCCSVCDWIVDWKTILRILFHHPDYMKPYEWVFCCDLCHAKIHLWLVNITDKIINIQSF